MDRLINENAVLSAIGEWIAHNEHTYTNATEYLRNRIKAIKTAEQEPCDCISRAEAIKTLNCEISGSIKSDIDLSKYKREFQEFANIIINAQEKAIQALPPVTPKPKTEWIPVSERMPEKSGLYLVTNRANEIEVFSFTGHDMARAFWSKYAKAWMPLPEPYKAEKE